MKGKEPQQGGKYGFEGQLMDSNRHDQKSLTCEPSMKDDYIMPWPKTEREGRHISLSLMFAHDNMHRKGMNDKPT